MSHIEARRTTLVGGRELDYERIHATIPEPVAAALTACGVLSWRIWRDQRLLFHVIETTHGYDAMVAEISALPPIDDEWDAMIAGLLDSTPGADVMLGQV